MSLAQWIQDARELSRQDISIVVVGNKCDQEELRLIDRIDANKFC